LATPHSSSMLDSGFHLSTCGQLFPKALGEDFAVG